MAQLGRIIFFTLSNDDARNPHSVIIIDALKQLGYASVVLYSAMELQLLTNHSEAVALVDCPVSGRVNHWRPELLCDQGTTSWARRLATRWLIKVTHRATSSPACIERAARQIAQTTPPWGPPRSAVSKKKKSRVSRPGRLAASAFC